MNEELSQCSKCLCMTKTTDGRCGKCVKIRLDSLAWDWVQSGHNQFMTEEDAEIARSNFKDDIGELLKDSKPNLLKQLDDICLWIHHNYGVNEIGQDYVLREQLEDKIKEIRKENYER